MFLKFLKFLKKTKYLIEGRIFKTPEIQISKTWIGNSYGGFFVNTKGLTDQSLIYSIGIGTDVSFDLELINTYGCRVYGFDPTPKSIQWIKENIIEPNFIMSEFGISNFSGIKKFYLPKNQNFVSGSILPLKTVNEKESIMLEFKNLSEAMQDNNHTHLDLLKMDIEGAEYDVLEDALNRSIRIDQIVVEFHPHLISQGRKKTKDIMNLLNKKGYLCFGISDSFLEFSYINTKVLSKFQ